MADKKISALTASSTPLAGTEVLPIVQSGSTVKVSVANLTAGRAVSASSLTASTDNIIIGTTAKGVTTGSAIPLGLGVNGAVTAVTIDTSNNVGVGTTSPGTRLDVVSAGNPTITLRGTDGAYTGILNIQAAGGGTSLINATGGSNTLSLYTNTVERFRVGSTGDATMVNGNLVIGTAAKGIDFSANTHAAGMTSELLNDYEEGTWTTTVSGVSNFTGTPTLASGKYTRVGRLITIEGKFSGTVTTGAANAYFEFTLPISRGAGTDGGAGSVISNANFKLGGIYNASANTTTAYLVMSSSSGQPSGADTFFFSYSYYA